MSSTTAIILTILMLAGNMFFVGAEFALVASRRDRLESLVAQGKRRAHTVLSATENMSMMLAASQLGITICSIVLGKVGEPAIAHLLATPLAPLGLSSDLLHAISFIVALTIVSILHILVGEMIPKNIALSSPESAAMILVPPQMLFVAVARPVIHIYNHAANLVLRLLGIHARDEMISAVNASELTDMIGESRSEGLIDAEEYQRLGDALYTSSRRIGEISIPLARIRSVPIRGAGPRLGDVEKAVTQTGFSRFPVTAADGTITGFLHVKDVLEEVLDVRKGADTVIPLDEVRPLITLSADTRVDDALHRMRRSGAHLALVTDSEDDTTVGVLALEDLTEEFIGTVRDATHRNQP